MECKYEDREGFIQQVIENEKVCPHPWAKLYQIREGNMRCRLCGAVLDIPEPLYE